MAPSVLCCYGARAVTSLTRETLFEVAERFGTPAYVYDAAILRRQLASLAAFDTIRFAQKACPNVHVQRLFRAGGAAVDCVSLGELVFTADVLTRDALERVLLTRVPLNAGSEDMLTQLGERSPGTPSGCASIRGLGTATAKRSTPEARAASTVSGTSCCPRRSSASTATGSSCLVCTFTWAPAPTSST